MPDWEQIVTQRLERLKLAPEERREVIAELSAHLEDCYRELCDAGSPDPEGYTLAQVPDWKALGRKIQKSKEDPMNQTTRALALVLCGILTGGILFFLSVLVFVFVLGETAFATALEAAGRPTVPALPWILLLAMGIWTMWLYTALRPRYGPGPKTAAVAGSALWVITALVEATWVSVRLAPIPLGALLAPLAAGLPTAIVAAVVGAWPYDQLSKPVKTPVPST